MASEKIPLCSIWLSQKYYYFIYFVTTYHNFFKEPNIVYKIKLKISDYVASKHCKIVQFYRNTKN